MSSLGLLAHVRRIHFWPSGSANRTYVIARFPANSRPGTRHWPALGRGKPVSRRTHPAPGSSFHAVGAESVRTKTQTRTQTRYELNPSIEVSESWEEVSRRAPPPNPEEGLRRLMDNQMLVITRQVEMVNVFIGLEHPNRYIISNESGEPIGYIAEEPRGFLSMISRELFRTRRAFRAVLLDTSGSPILWFHRPLAWINSRMFVQHVKDLNFNEHTAEGGPIPDTFAEVQQRWHLWRHRYDLFIRETPLRFLSTPSERQSQPELDPESYIRFARVDEGVLAWNFTVRDERGEAIARVERTFRGVGKESPRGAGQCLVRFTPSRVEGPERDSSIATKDLSLEERALVLALAVNIDFDFFSRNTGVRR